LQRFIIIGLTNLSRPNELACLRYKLEKQAHAIYALTYHYICVVKYRRQIFTNELIINRLKEINYDIAEKFGVKIINQETDRDYIHIIFSAAPTCDLIRFINSLKGVSSRLLRKEFPVIKHQLWRGVLWSPSYFLCTTGQVTLDQLTSYVEAQEEKR
jgi:putative transposase